jgi:hypothetical protein
MRNHNNKGQAAAELAIFGALLLFAFSVLLLYGQRLDKTQQLKMEAFRKAMQTAYYKNSAISYNYKEDTHITDLFSGFGQGQHHAASASATVMWQKGLPGGQGSDDQQSFSYYNINGKEIEMPRYEKEITGMSGDTQEVKVSTSVWKEEVETVSTYNSSINKHENPENIENKRSADLQEDITSALYTRYDATEYDERNGPQMPEYVYAGDEYHNPYYSSVDTGEQCVKETCIKNSSLTCTCANTGIGGAEECYQYQCIKTYTITQPGPVTQGAYLTDDNRIGYNETNAGGTVHKERTWQTAN